MLAAGPVGLADPAQGQHQAGRAEDRDEPEIAAPAPDRLDQPADQGGEARCAGHQGGDDGHGPGQRRPVEQVARHGPHQHDAGAGTDRLQHPPDQQGLQRRGQRAGDAGGDIERQTRQQDRAPPVAIGERPDDKLAERQPRQEHGQGQPDVGRGGLQVGRQAGQGGQVEIGGQQPQGRQGGQQGQQAAAPGADVGQGQACGGSHAAFGHRSISPGCRLFG